MSLKQGVLWHTDEQGGGFIVYGWTWRRVSGTYLNTEVGLWYMAEHKGRFMIYDWTRRQVQLNLVGGLYSMWSQAVVIQEEEAVTDNFCTLYQQLYSDQEKTWSTPCTWQREGLVDPKGVRTLDTAHVRVKQHTLIPSSTSHIPSKFAHWNLSLSVWQWWEERSRG